MNGLEIILILLVPLLVWIFSSVFKGDGDRPATGPNAASRTPTQRRPVSDLDRFLEEARRRREAAERGQQANPEAQQRPAPLREQRPAPMPERRPVRSQTPPRRRNVETAPSRTARAPILLEPVADSPAPVFSGSQVAAPLPETVGAVAPVAPAVAVPIPAALTALPSPGVQPALSPALVQLAELLRSPRAAGTAIILKEIFDRPLSRRRG